MEYKVRRESETMMEKVFNKHCRKGLVKTDNVAKMLKDLNPDLEWNDEQLGEAVRSADRSGTGIIDFEGFNKIAMHFLIKQVKHDNDQFNYKNDIMIEDLPGGFRPPEKQMPYGTPSKTMYQDPFTHKSEVTVEDFPKPY